MACKSWIASWGAWIAVIALFSFVVVVGRYVQMAGSSRPDAGDPAPNAVIERNARYRGLSAEEAAERVQPGDSRFIERP